MLSWTGRHGIDFANEVACLLPELLPGPLGMLRPDGLKATAWDHSLGVAGLLGCRGQGSLCFWLFCIYVRHCGNDSCAYQQSTVCSFAWPEQLHRWNISRERRRKSKAEHNAFLKADVIVRGVRQFVWILLPVMCLERKLLFLFLFRSFVVSFVQWV